MQTNLVLSFVDFVKEYWKMDKNFMGIDGKVRLIIDAILVVIAFLLLIIFLGKYTKRKNLIIGTTFFVLAFAIVEIFDLTITRYIVLAILIVVICLMALSVSSYFKGLVNSKNKIKNTKNFVFDEEAKNELINTLIKTVEHLSSRRIGGIITIEKENSLNAYLDKAVRLDATVTYELLNTIFHPNTALHDGAVIIRGNRILCASAFYPSSDKADIPQYFGSRHRAAIGISEVCDAFTIVVSEETGKIATTIGGTISENISLESLRVSLEQHIIVQ